LHSAKPSSTRSVFLVAAFAIGATGSAVALLFGSDSTALIGVGLAGLAGVLIVFHVMLSERQRHEIAEEELASQAHFLESLVDSFGDLAATLDVDELLELTRSEAARLFRTRAELLAPGERRPNETVEGELLVPLRARDEELGMLRLVWDEPVGRENLVRATVFGDFASQVIENARLLAEAQVREAERARLSEQLITAEQEERRRLALFLHDTSVQSLSGIALMLDAALHAVSEQRWEDAASVLEGALTRHRQTIRALRDLSFNLEPVVLRDQGFSPAVGALAQQLGLEQELQIVTDVAAAEGLSQQAQAALYQIIREALDASIRRGPPTRVAIRAVPTQDGGTEVTIVDDAPGERRRAVFDALAERARTLSGELTVDGGDGGTRVRVTLPPSAARG
jgi:signal transduction histidine kinase